MRPVKAIKEYVFRYLHISMGQYVPCDTCSISAALEI